MARAGEVNGGKRSRSWHAAAGQGGRRAPHSHVAPAPWGATLLPNSFLGAGLHLLEDEAGAARHEALARLMMGNFSRHPSVQRVQRVQGMQWVQGMQRVRWVQWVQRVQRAQQVRHSAGSKLLLSPAWPWPELLIPHFSSPTRI